jgi:hypothetical protein
MGALDPLTPRITWMFTARISGNHVFFSRVLRWPETMLLAENVGLLSFPPSHRTANVVVWPTVQNLTGS